MLEQAGNEQFTLHPLLRMFAQILLEEDSTELHDAGERHSRHFLAVLTQAKSLYLNDLSQSSELLEINWQNVQAGWSWASSRYETEDEAARLCLEYLDAGDPWLSFLPADEHADWARTAIRSAQRLRDVSAEASNLIRLGFAHQRTSQLDKAKECYEMAIEKFREINDRQGEGRALAFLGTCFKAMGDLDSAVAYQCSRKALELARDLNNPHSEAMALGGMASARARMGEIEKAYSLYKQQLQISEFIEDPRGVARTHNNLAGLLREKGKLDEALWHIDAALREYGKAPYPLGEADVLWNGGLTLDQKGERERACESLRQALDMYKRINSPKARDVEDQLRKWRKDGPH